MEQEQLTWKFIMDFGFTFYYHDMVFGSGNGDKQLEDISKPSIKIFIRAERILNKPHFQLFIQSRSGGIKAILRVWGGASNQSLAQW
jgi:hypothetical protein